MSYRSSLSFVPLHIYSLKLRALDFDKLLKITVLLIFSLLPSRFWADFWYVRLPSCLCPHVFILKLQIFSTFWDGAIRVALTHLVFFINLLYLQINDGKEAKKLNWLCNLIFFFFYIYMLNLTILGKFNVPIKNFKIFDHIYFVSETYIMSKIWSQSKFRQYQVWILCQNLPLLFTIIIWYQM